MAGSKGGKHTKGKGKSKSKKPEQFKSKNDLAEKSNKDSDRPMDSSWDTNSNSATSTSRPEYTDEQVEQLLHQRLVGLYTKANDWLLKAGFSMSEIEGAILSASIFGPMDMQTNILMNSISLIEKKIEPNGKAFKDMDELYKAMVSSLISHAMQSYSDMPKVDAMWKLFLLNWGSLPSTTMGSTSTHGSCGSKNEDSGALASSSTPHNFSYESYIDSSLKRVGKLKRVGLKPALVSRLRHNVPIIAAALHGKIGAPVIKQQAVSDIESFDYLTSTEGLLEGNTDDDKKTELLVDLVKRIDNLYDEVEQQKEWAQKKVIDSAKRLNKDFLELRILRIEKLGSEREKMNAKRKAIVSMMKVLYTKQILHNENSKVHRLTEAARNLEIRSAQSSADTEAYNLNASELDQELNVVMKRQKKCMKILAEIEKQRSIFEAQCEEEKQRMLDLELELLQVETEAEETEIKWGHAIKEKEQMLALLAEEFKMAETRNANSRAELLKLRQKVDIESQLMTDDCQRLEDELSRLHISRPMPDLSVEDYIFSCNSLEGTSSESSAPHESYEKTSHQNCMCCMDNEVTVVFLPCTHQVVCLSCYEGRCKMGGLCPYCGTQIEQIIKVYGPGS